MLDPTFINIVGSSIEGKEKADLDILVRANPSPEFEEIIRKTIPESLKDVELIWDPSGPNGPYIPAYSLFLSPAEESKPMEPKYTIQPMSPIPPAQATREIDRESAYSLFEDSYYLEPISGIRAMIHRRENHIMAFGVDLEPLDIPKEVKGELLRIEDPQTFILDGFLGRDNGKPMFYLMDMPWWRESEHVKQNAEVRKYFLKKLPDFEYIQRNKAKYFDSREDVVSFLSEVEDSYLLVPGSTTYPIQGDGDWLLYAPKIEAWRLAESSDDKIKRLINNNEWESKSANERFDLMTKRKKIEPVYPFAQLKTTKKGYSAREVFGLKSVDDLAKRLFKVPNKQAVEVKIDGFRAQIHKKGDQVKLYTESGLDITDRLPSIVEDVKSLPAESLVFDAEITPYNEEFTNLGRRAAAPAFAKGAKKAIDDELWIAHVFDILYLDGEDLHNVEYEKRRTRLRGIELPTRDHPDSKSDFKFQLWENNVYWATSAEGMIRLAEKASEAPGSEGAMFKQAESKYRLSGNTPLWSKMKRSFEIDAIIVGSKKDGNTFNYIGAIGPISGVQAEETAPIESTRGKDFVKYKGKVYSILGKTFNTNMEADVGDIIRVTVKETRKIKDNVYHWFHPKVLEVREDKTKPDPLKTAETIAESAKGQQKVSKSGYLSTARFGEESPIACCNAPWIIVESEGDWVYLRNDDTLLENLKQLEVNQIYASAVERDLAEALMASEIDFQLTNSATIADFKGRPVYAETGFPPDKVYIVGEDLKSFYQSIQSHPDVHMKLSCGGGLPLPELNAKKFASDPYLTYPDESKSWKYVVQFHFRGLSVHADFRSEINNKQLIGWTWDAGKSLVKPLLRRVDESELKAVGLTKKQLDDMEIADVSSKLRSSKEGRSLMSRLREKSQDLSFKQLTVLANELWDETVKEVMENPEEKVLTQKKAPEPHSWLKYEGEVPAGAVGATSELEGQFIIMDEGTIEYGAQKQYYHEYFLNGKRLKGKLVVRRLPTRKEWDTRQSFAWLTFMTKPGDMPYAISSRAVNQEWMPPKRVSAIPKEIREQIPDNRKYWKAKNAKEIRDQLVKEIKKDDVTLKLAKGLQFAVKRVWHKGPEVRRGMPIVRYWFLLHDGSKVMDAWDFGRDSNPLETDGLLAIRRDTKQMDKLLKTAGEISADHPASQTRSLPNEFDTSDSGKAEVITDQNDMMRLRLSGELLDGIFVFLKRDPGSNSWIFQKAELPEPKKSMLLQAATCATGVCSTTGVMQLSAEDFKYEKVGNLLFIKGPAIKPGEVVPMDGKPARFTKKGIQRLWPSMYRQPIVVLHVDLKGDVIGFVDKIHYDEKTGWGWVDRGVIWHPEGMKWILEGKLPAFSIEVIPESVWDPENQHDVVIGGNCVGLAVVPKGACVTCNYTEAIMGEIEVNPGEVYKFGMTLEDYINHQYWAQGLSTQKISNQEGIPRSTVEYYMKQTGTPRRSYLEARHLRMVNEANIRKFGGRASILAVGTGAFTDIPRDECPQCKEAVEGGKSRRNYTATVFMVGSENLLVNAPKGIAGMLGVNKVKPDYVLVEHIHEDVVGGLHELRAMNPSVFATEEVWKWLRAHYKAVSGEKGEFEEVYGFQRYIIKTGQGFSIGDSFEVRPIQVEHAKKGDPAALGFKITIGGKTIWHCSDVLDIPDKEEVLSDVDIYIGDGASLSKGIPGGANYGHTSIEEQLKWAKEAEIEQIYFTQIGHIGKTHEDLEKTVSDITANANIMFDGMKVDITGNRAAAYFSDKVAREIMEGKRSILVRTKPYSEYARQVILLAGDKVHALYIEGFPEGPFPADEVKSMKDKHGMSNAEWKKKIGSAEKVWIYKPRVLKRFNPPKEYLEAEPAGPYIHDLKMI